ncbi:proteoglycan 4a [Scophthalmus maximus]|uniref:proteoglycan 4a n=1 Tax=Scophthalmus maximus TaxID=52904 RepID=UPI001FA89AC5|nr:proteoglycan 4a [Scophthalmus maximus]
MQHNECCPDFEATCTTAQSCLGRCGEPFRRGQQCECDPECVRHNTCCRDYQRHCDASVSVSGSHPRTFQPLGAKASGHRKSEGSKKGSNSESEELYKGVTDISVGLLPASAPSSHGGTPDSRARMNALPSNSVPSQGGRAPVSPSGPSEPLVLLPGGAAPYVPSQGLTGSRPRPNTLLDIAQALGLSEVDTGSERPGAGLLAGDVCSDSPIDGLTALSNGTILIFKGELFWSVDPVSHLPGRPQSITDRLGVSSPIDTVFTRCNCHRNTYIIKGDHFWRFDRNMVVEPGFPKPLASEFPGLTGTISAALAVPATRKRPETVYFFKGGDMMQSFTYAPGSTPSCSGKSRSSTHQAALQGGEIKIKLALRGFPTPVTSALSMPSPQRSDRYHHYVFSGTVFFSVHIVGSLPALAKPDPSAALAPLPILSPATTATNAANMAAHNANPTYPAYSIRVWLRCP